MDVYSTISGSKYDIASSIISCHHTYLGLILILFEALFKTITCSIDEQKGIASSTTFFNSSFPLLKPPSAVITTLEFESFTLSDNACPLKPENRTVMYGILEHANIAIGSSGTMGR